MGRRVKEGGGGGLEVAKEGISKEGWGGCGSEGGLREGGGDREMVREEGKSGGGGGGLSRKEMVG